MRLASPSAPWRLPPGLPACFAVLLSAPFDRLAAAPANQGGGPDSTAVMLAQNQQALGAFFLKHGAAFLKEATPLVVGVAGTILVAVALTAWFFDVLLAWGFSTLAAPAYARISRALVYAGGRLVLALALTTVIGVAAIMGIKAGAGWAALPVVGLLTLLALFIQVFWIGWLYRSSARDSGLFYFVLLLMHGLVAAILIPFFFAQQINRSITRFGDDAVVPRLQQETAEVRQGAAAAVQRRAAAAAVVDNLQARLNQDKADEVTLRQEITAHQNSPAEMFSHLVALRAQGRLTDAATGLAALIAQYPHEAATGAARGQLSQINQEIALRNAAQQAKAATAARDQARARAQLLTRAAAARANLSDMRVGLLGKTTVQVFAMFGEPTERGADRWGYARHMVLDDSSGQTYGLTVLFNDGYVQGVDYYYGTGP